MTKFKMKLIVVLLLMSSNILSQNWIDSVNAAKKSYESGKYEDAYRQFENAQKIAPQETNLTKDLGTTAYRKGDYEKSQKAYDLATSDSSNPLEAAKIWHNQGNCYLKQKKYEEAIESYKQSLRLNPSDEETRYNLSEAKRRMKQQADNQSNNDNSENQNQNQNQDQNQNQNQNDSNNNQDNKQNDSQSQQSSDNQNNQDQSNQSPEQKLSSRKTENMLDELMRKELETKRKMHQSGVQKGEGVLKSGKKW